ncbi:hypothetical protein [Streptococcus sp. XMC]|uniref:hypothetical protein n=1 Tax=Streptococcus TaxID=1301 RepID=UPI001E4F75A4|nr:hypothetical protein [Streptococcus sp. XMC]MCE3591919.1 hypothetical protein [Streptococcus sp. XMC]
MKKVTLYALSILSLAVLAACQPAAPETHQRKPLVSSSKKSSKSSKSSYSKKSSSKKDFSSGLDKDDSYSSSDSNTREDPNYTMSLMDQGESLEAIGDIPEMPKWAAFKEIKVEILVGNEALAPTTKDEAISKLGPTDSTSDNSGYWHGEGSGIMISFNEKGQATNKIATLPNSKKVTNLKDIQPGMTAKEVIEKHGRPETVFVFGYATIFTWKGEDGKDYSVGFDKEKVFQVSEPA